MEKKERLRRHRGAKKGKTLFFGARLRAQHLLLFSVSSVVRYLSLLPVSPSPRLPVRFFEAPLERNAVDGSRVVLVYSETLIQERLRVCRRLYDQPRFGGRCRGRLVVAA
jgi:hypothetical protein